MEHSIQDETTTTALHNDSWQPRPELLRAMQQIASTSEKIACTSAMTRTPNAAAIPARTAAPAEICRRRRWAPTKLQIPAVVRTSGTSALSAQPNWIWMGTLEDWISCEATW